MWMWFNIWWRKNINQQCISFRGNFHESFYSNEQRLGALRPSCTIEVSLLLQILHAFDKVLTLHGLVLWCFKMKTLHMLIHSWIMWNKPKQSNDDKISWRWNDIENNLAIWKPMLTSNGLVSWVTSSDERLQPSWLQLALMCYFPLKSTYIVIHKQHDLVFHNKNKNYLYVNIISLVPWELESCFINMHGVSIWWGCWRLGWHCRWEIRLYCNSVNLLCVVDVGSWHFF